jgi:hypothetical protein
MRVAATVSTLLVLAMGAYVACAPASIGEYPETDIELPAQKKDAGSSSNTDSGSGQTFKLTVTIAGTGSGSVTSTPSGVSCQDRTCTGTFAAGTTVGIVPAPAAGSTFTSWGGACSGNGVCTPTMSADVAVTATIDGGGFVGTYSGNYTNNRTVNGCTFNNAGTITMTFAPEGTGFTSMGTITGVQLRTAAPQCNVAVPPSSNGTANKEVVTVAGATATGTWTYFLVTPAGAAAAFPYTMTVAGNQLTGSWTCAGCTGNFTLTKQ